MDHDGTLKRTTAPAPKLPDAGATASAQRFSVASTSSTAIAEQPSLAQVTSTSSPGSLPTEPELDFRSNEEPRPFTPGELEHLAYQTGLVSDYERSELDLAKTVQATARGAGLWQPMYRFPRRVSRVCVALLPMFDPVTEVIVESFVSGLRQHGMLAEVSRGRPRSEVADATLLVVDSSVVAGATLAEWLKEPHVALVEARDPALWGDEVEKLPCGVFAPDLPGLTAALSVALDGRRPPPVQVLPGGDTMDRLGDALALATAMALAAPCDLTTGDQLRRMFAPHLPFCRFQRVARLRGVIPDPTGWRFSLSLYEWLCQRAQTAFRIRILSWHRRRLLRLFAIPGSWAAFIKMAESALAEWQISVLVAQSPETSQVRTDQSIKEVLDELEPSITDARRRHRLRERARQIAKALPASHLSAATNDLFRELLGVASHSPPEEQSEQRLPSTRSVTAPTLKDAASPQAPSYTEKEEAHGDTESWTVAQGKAVGILEGHSGWVLFASLNKGGSQAVTTSSDCSARVWRFGNEKDLLLRQHRGWVVSAAFSPNGERIVTAGRDGRIFLWATGDGVPLYAFGEHDSPVWSVSFGHDGNEMISGDASGWVIIWNVIEEPRVVQKFRDPGPVWVARLSPDGRYAFSGSSMNSSILWDRRTGLPDARVGKMALVHPYGASNRVTAAEFSPDGHTMIVGGENCVANVLDLESCRPIAILSGHRGRIASAAFSADGSWIITASHDGTARVWEASSGRSLAKLDTRAEAAFCAEFTAHGVRVVAATPPGLKNRLIARRGYSYGLENVLVVWDVALPETIVNRLTSS